MVSVSPRGGQGPNRLREEEALFRFLAVLALLACTQSAYSSSFDDLYNRQDDSATASAVAGAEASSSFAAAPEEDRGIWTDSTTGLTWARCQLGLAWKGWHCDGNMSELPWWDAALAVDGAEFGGYNDWRIPTLRELNHIHNSCGPAAFINPEQPSSDYLEIATGDGLLKVQKSCSKGDISPRLNMTARFNEPMYDRSWSSTPAGVFNGRPQYWVFKLHDVPGTSIADDVKEMYALPFIDRSLAYWSTSYVWLVRGGSYTEFNDMLKAARAEEGKAIDPVAEAASVEKMISEKRSKAAAEATARRALASQEAQKKHEAFRRNLKVGDGIFTYAGDAFRGGIVLELKGDVVRVQLDVSNSSTIERWVKRSSLFARKDFIFY